MTAPAGLLAALQMGDSAFPSGGFAFSWGLETLAADGAVRGRDGVAAFASGQLRRRWATADRVFLRRAYDAGSPDRLAAIDREVEAMTLPAALREGSRRAGRALLRAHAGLGAPEAAAWRRAIARGEAPGHLPVAQAVAWRAAGLDRETAEAVSAYALVSGVAQAAVRLALIGPIEAQAVLTALRAGVARALAGAPPRKPHAFAPLAEIAAMRRETASGRLFVN